MNIEERAEHIAIDHDFFDDQFGCQRIDIEICCAKIAKELNKEWETKMDDMLNKEYLRGIEDGKIIAEHGTVNWID